MKRYGTVLTIIVAVASGFLAVVLVNRWLSSRTGPQKSAVQQAMPLTKIAIAGKDLEVGAKLTPETLTLAEWPKATMPKGAFESLEAAQGRVAVTRLRAGEPILASELAAPGSGAGLVAVIKPGMRAMALRVDEIVGVAGFILPNTFVDVIAVKEIKGQQGQKTVKTLLQRIEVLAVAQETFTEDGKPKLVKSVTLQVAPAQAEKLALQMNEGPIHLALLNPVTEETAPPPPPVTVARRAARPLPPVAAPVPVVALPPPPAPAPPPPYAVEIIRGSKPPEVIRFRSAASEERL